MSKYVVDFANDDKAELLNLTNNDNTATIQTNLTTAVVDVTNLQAITVEPVDRKVFAEELLDATGYNVVGRTEYNSDYAAAAILGIPRESLMAHLTRKVIYGNTFKDVFNDWKRISHLETTESQPAKASELDSWAYDEVADAVRCTLNSATFIGLVSNYKIYGDYTFDTIMGSSDGDNDSGVIVLAFVVDDQGKEHTLCAVRSRSVEGHLKVNGKFDIWYNYKQSSRKLIATGGGTENDGSWTNFFSRITAVKTGNNFVVEATSFTNSDDVADHGPTNIAVSHRFGLGDHPELQKFVNGAGFGYGAMSQSQITYGNVLRPDQREASAFKEIQTFTTALDGDKYYRIAYLDQVEEEGEATDGSVVDTTPSRSHLATLVNKAYVKDKVDVRFNRVNLTDVMEMTVADGDFDWHNGETDDYMSTSPVAQEHASAVDNKWTVFNYLAPTSDWSVPQGKFFVRKWHFFEEGDHVFKFWADDVTHVWVDETEITGSGAAAEVTVPVTRGWHCITLMAFNVGDGPAYIGGTIAKDGAYVLKTDLSWKALDVTTIVEYDENRIPPIGYDREQYKELALEAFKDAAMRQGIDTDEQMAGISLAFVERNELGANVVYMVMTFESYTLNDGVHAEFRLPAYFSDVISVTRLRGFVYVPIESVDVVE